MFSTYCQYKYAIEVFVPEMPTPAEGFPVIIVLDGQRYAHMMYLAMKNQMLVSEKTKVNPSIIVSVGHQLEDARNRRFYDFTAPALHYHFPVRRGKAMEPVAVGGAASFQQFIMHELIPYVCTHYPVNRAQFSLYGHSLGGLFSLWCFLTMPHLFDKYVAISPSIWWNQHEVLDKLSGTLEKIATPIAIYVGGEEGFMVKDAEDFYQQCQARNLHVQFYVALEENHASVIPATLSRALRFVSSTSNGEGEIYQE